MTEPSPIEVLSLGSVRGEMVDVMRAQFEKGRKEYGCPIDDWAAVTGVAIKAEEAMKEGADFIAYLNALDPEFFGIDVHRIATIAVKIQRWRDRELGHPYAELGVRGDA